MLAHLRQYDHMKFCAFPMLLTFSAAYVILACACGGDECNPAAPAASCGRALPRTDPFHYQSGWMSYEDERTRLMNSFECAQQGSCSDGKTFLTASANSAGSARFYRKGTLVGAWEWSDASLEGCACDFDPTSHLGRVFLGDVRCEVADLESLCASQFPQGPPDFTY